MTAAVGYETVGVAMSRDSCKQAANYYSMYDDRKTVAGETDICGPAKLGKQLIAHTRRQNLTQTTQL